RVRRVVLDSELLVDAQGDYAGNARLRRLGGEGIVGDLRCEESHRIEEGRLPRVGLAYQANPDDQKAKTSIAPLERRSTYSCRGRNPSLRVLRWLLWRKQNFRGTERTARPSGP